jgi:DNA/RNA-binding domain of Phe-tRNA-synthetase-like protein
MPAIGYAAGYNPSRTLEMSSNLPVIHADIYALRPDFRALSIHATGVKNLAAHVAAAIALSDACTSPCNEAWAVPHLEAWAEAYRAFGAKPQRTLCSAEALLKRVKRDGALGGINAVVDFYNAVSLKYALPVGGENLAAYVSAPRLVRADGTEVFDTMQSGVPAIEAPEKGEVVWRDDHGVTCRRWNWRQGTRTRIDVDTTEMWFVLEALDPMPEEALRAAGDELIRGLRILSPACAVETILLRK